MKKKSPKPDEIDKPARARLSLDLDTSTKESFEKIRATHGVGTMTDLVKKGINCFDAFMNQQKKGQVIFKDEDGSERRILIL